MTNRERAEIVSRRHSPNLGLHPELLADIERAITEARTAERVGLLERLNDIDVIDAAVIAAHEVPKTLGPMNSGVRAALVTVRDLLTKETTPPGAAAPSAVANQERDEARAVAGALVSQGRQGYGRRRPVRQARAEGPMKTGLYLGQILHIERKEHFGPRHGSVRCVAAIVVDVTRSASADFGRAKMFDVDGGAGTIAIEDDVGRIYHEPAECPRKMGPLP